MSVLRSLRITGLVGLMILGVLAVSVMAVQAQSGDGQGEEGARLFAENCAVCHGQEGEGRVGATLAKDWPSIRPDLTVASIIRQGVPGSPMPAWSQDNGGPLSEDQIEAIVAYILSWQTGGAPQYTPAATATRRPPITPIPQVEGDPNSGALLFDQNCAVCHGIEAEGRIGKTLAKEWGSARSDLFIRNAIATGVEGAAMPAWSQAQGGPLTESEIDDLVAFILTLSQERPSAQSSPTVIAPETPPSAFLRGWGGVVLFVVLFAAIIGAALYFQRRREIK